MYFEKKLTTKILTNNLLLFGVTKKEMRNAAADMMMRRWSSEMNFHKCDMNLGETYGL